MAFPPRMLVIEPGAVVDVKDKDGEIVLQKFGQRGIVAVREGESIDEAVARARVVRMEFLETHLNRFRAVNAARRAAGQEVMLPSAYHRRWLRELKELRAQVIEDDRELLGFDETAVKDAQRVDVAVDSLREFGIDERVMPLVPGVPDNMLESIK